jgi:prophage antirepressor-like protein
MNELKVFCNENLGQVRVIENSGDPWFVLKDVCEVLGLTNPTMIAGRLDEEEVTKFNLGGLSGEINIVNESGLYNVILRSDKPQAKQFKKWITAEVLPSIRKHGAYMTADTIERTLTDPDYLISLATALKEEKAKRMMAEQQIEADKPKVLFADAVSSSKTSILIGELAKLLRQNGIQIGQNRLFEELRNRGYLIKRVGADWNMPTQRSMELELFEIKEHTHIDGNGCNITTKTTKVTGKGQQYFINKFLSA